MGLVMSEAIKNVEELDLNDILPNRFQPRIKFNEEKICKTRDKSYFPQKTNNFRFKKILASTTSMLIF